MEENKLNVNAISVLVPIALIGVVLMFFVPLLQYFIGYRNLQALNITISITIFFVIYVYKKYWIFQYFPSYFL